ncbi:SagB/ThcOx family dehydrogenase [bacterium]|nr:SagB/ThcOx family dehydrogenase [bacterium]MBU1433746.1 SagB/ThcOx family dehydrogenase [bacterium]MBU1503821.1 SagB/ThcOx family dehydrogenase [bacterium]
MDKNLQTIFKYHEETKHSHKKYARSLGYMDWANQPNPYRNYNGADEVLLPLATEHTTPPYHLIFEKSLPSAPLLINSISQFMQFSMGLAAIKSDGQNEWALRCNASSGNLHPSEAYLILPPLNGICEQTSISHYAPKNHSLEILKSYDCSIWKTLPEGSFFVALSSILYREIWKYGERAFRYTQLDAGHAAQALHISAKTLGWKYQHINAINDEDLSKLFGFDDALRFNENEHEIADMLLLITPDDYHEEVNFSELFNSEKFNSIANAIASNYQKWPLITEVEKAAFSVPTLRKTANEKSICREPSKEAKEIILKRRSAQVMNAHNTHISYQSFFTMMQSTLESFNGLENSVNLFLFVHDVENLEAGLYLYLRNETQLEELKNSMSEAFVWDYRDENLYALKYGDFRDVAKAYSCNQNIASDGAFSLGMLSSFSDDLLRNGAHRYKEMYWECGAIGQQLYLEATAFNLSATGIGCFLDDEMHTILGLKNNKFQSLYHFTVGRGLVDNRLLTLKPYSNR